MTKLCDPNHSSFLLVLPSFLLGDQKGRDHVYEIAPKKPIRNTK